MKLALLVEYYAPSRASAAVQMADLAAAFVSQGHEVTVFTTDPGTAAASLTSEPSGLAVLRVPTAKVKGVSLTRRAFSEIFMSLALWRGTRRCRLRVDDFDGVIWYSPTIFLAPFAAWLKRTSCARGYLILRDIFPQWALDAGVLRRGPAYYFFRLAERFQYRTADVIGAQSPANVEHVRADTCAARRTEVLYNWLDLDRPEPARSNVLEQHGLEGRRVLVYGGNMGIAQDMDNLMCLAERLLPADEVRLLLVGAGTEVDRLQRLVVERGLTNVTLIDEVDPEVFRAILRCCHVGLITLDRRLTTHNIPGKLLAYLEAGLPVVASVNPGNDLLRILSESGAGVGVVNGDDDGFARAVLELAADPVRREVMSQKARALALEHFSVDAISGQLIGALAPDFDLQGASRVA